MDYNIPLVERWAEDRNLIEGSTPQAQMLKLLEEAGELASGIAKNNRELIVDSVGDVMVVLTILCKQLSINMSECYRIAYLEIKNRKGVMRDGIFVKEES